MNTYTVTYIPTGATSPYPQITVQAADFEYIEEAVLFTDTSKTVVLAVPLSLHPIIQRTAAA